MCMVSCCRRPSGEHYLLKGEIYHVKKRKSSAIIRCSINNGFMDIPESILDEYFITLAEYTAKLREERINKILDI